MAVLFEWRADMSGVQAKARDQLGRFQEANQAVKRANEASVAWLGTKAADNLTKHRHRAPDPRHPLLEDILTDPYASSAGIDGFEFFIDANVQEISDRVFQYIRAIEFGSTYWVERTTDERFGLRFYGPGGEGGQAGMGSWINKSFPQVHIRNPVPAYHSIGDAIQSFRKSNQYYKLVYNELRGIGIEPQTRAMRRAAARG
jgi:hypothetical protein